MAELPAELWLPIAQDLPESQLFELKSLNIFFLNYWMDLKWKDVTIDLKYPEAAVRLLGKMVYGI